MKTNNHGQIVLSDSDVINAWLQNKTIDYAVFENTAEIDRYNKWCDIEDLDGFIRAEEEYSGDNYVEHCVNHWNMPEEYKQLDIVEYLLSLTRTSEQRDRVAMETQEFERRGLIDVLRFLKYLVDLCNENNIVLGVGRGSSVASYCLFLIGVHKIDSLKYDLDIKEFLKNE